MNFIKKHLLASIQASSLLVLFLIILGYFVDFGEQVNELVRTGMFCLIGLAYLTFAWAHDQRIVKLALLSCGVYVIMMNFLPPSEWKSIIGIIAILTPMILGRFLGRREEAGNSTIS